MRRASRWTLLCGAIALAPAGPLAAADLDASQPLLCELVAVSQCDGNARCTELSFAQIDMPPIWRIDFGAQQLLSEDRLRSSPIGALETLDGVLVLQGHQNGRGWTAVIDRTNGHLSATAADVEGSIALAGACSPE